MGLGAIGSRRGPDEDRTVRAKMRIACLFRTCPVQTVGHAGTSKDAPPDVTFLSRSFLGVIDPLPISARADRRKGERCALSTILQVCSHAN